MLQQGQALLQKLDSPGILAPGSGCAQQTAFRRHCIRHFQQNPAAAPVRKKQHFVISLSKPAPTSHVGTCIPMSVQVLPHTVFIAFTAQSQVGRALVAVSVVLTKP